MVKRSVPHTTVRYAAARECRRVNGRRQLECLLQRNEAEHLTKKGVPMKRILWNFIKNSSSNGLLGQGLMTFVVSLRSNLIGNHTIIMRMFVCLFPLKSITPQRI